MRRHGAICWLDIIIIIIIIGMRMGVVPGFLAGTYPSMLGRFPEKEWKGWRVKRRKKRRGIWARD